MKIIIRRVVRLGTEKLVDGGIQTMTLELLGVSEFLNKINLGGKLLMSIASNMCNFKMEKNE